MLGFFRRTEDNRQKNFNRRDAETQRRKTKISGIRKLYPKIFFIILCLFLLCVSASLRFNSSLYSPDCLTPTSRMGIVTLCPNVFFRILPMRCFPAFFLMLLGLFPLRADEPITITKEKNLLEFKLGKELVTRYYIDEAGAKPYFWPLNAPGEIPTTCDWPMVMVKGKPKESIDHVHQKSGWFCHGDVIPEGMDLKVHSLDKHVKGVDFWSETLGHGKIVCMEVGEPIIEKERGKVTTRNEWRTADGVKILDEVRTITFIPTSTARLLILDIDLHASVCPIVFGDTKEGSFGVRVNDEIRSGEGNGYFVNASGKKNEKEVWGYISDWCDYCGKVGDKPVGIAILSDPKNPYPSAWHSRAYGLMAANPFGRKASGFPSQKDQTELARIEKGGHLKLRYAFVPHQGDTKEGHVAEAFERFTKGESKSQ